MKASLSITVKTATAMLCVALSLIFAGASAASLVDKVQHQGAAARAHEHMVFSVAFEGDHHDGDYADDVVRGDDATADHQPGAGHHHHADGPTGVIAPGESFEAVTSRPGARLSPLSDHLIRSPGSPGPQRPPKPLTTSA